MGDHHAPSWRGQLSPGQRGEEYYRRPVPKKRYDTGPSIAKGNGPAASRRVSVESPANTVKMASAMSRSLCSQACPPSLSSMASALSGGSDLLPIRDEMLLAAPPQPAALPQAQLHSPPRTQRQPPPLAYSPVSPASRQVLSLPLMHAGGQMADSPSQPRLAGMPLLWQPLPPPTHHSGSGSGSSSSPPAGGSDTLSQVSSLVTPVLVGTPEWPASGVHNDACHSTVRSDASAAFISIDSSSAQLSASASGSCCPSSSISGWSLQDSAPSVRCPAVREASEVSTRVTELTDATQATVACMECREPYCCCEGHGDEGLGREVGSSDGSSTTSEYTLTVEGEGEGGCVAQPVCRAEVSSCATSRRDNTPHDEMLLPRSPCKSPDVMSCATTHRDNTPHDELLVPRGTPPLPRSAVSSAVSRPANTPHDDSLLPNRAGSTIASLAGSFGNLPPSASAAHLDAYSEDDQLGNTNTSYNSMGTYLKRPAVNRMVSVETALVLGNTAATAPQCTPETTPDTVPEACSPLDLLDRTHSGRVRLPCTHHEEVGSDDACERTVPAFVGESTSADSSVGTCQSTADAAQMSVASGGSGGSGPPSSGCVVTPGAPPAPPPTEGGGSEHSRRPNDSFNDHHGLGGPRHSRGSTGATDTPATTASTSTAATEECEALPRQVSGGASRPSSLGSVGSASLASAGQAAGRGKAASDTPVVPRDARSEHSGFWATPYSPPAEVHSELSCPLTVVPIPKQAQGGVQEVVVEEEEEDTGETEDTEAGVDEGAEAVPECAVEAALCGALAACVAGCVLCGVDLAERRERAWSCNNVDRRDILQDLHTVIDACDDATSEDVTIPVGTSGSLPFTGVSDISSPSQVTRPLFSSGTAHGIDSLSSCDEGAPVPHCTPPTTPEGSHPGGSPLLAVPNDVASEAVMSHDSLAPSSFPQLPSNELVSTRRDATLTPPTPLDLLTLKDVQPPPAARRIPAPPTQSPGHGPLFTASGWLDEEQVEEALESPAVPACVSPQVPPQAQHAATDLPCAMYSPAHQREGSLQMFSDVATIGSDGSTSHTHTPVLVCDQGAARTSSSDLQETRCSIGAGTTSGSSGPRAESRGTSDLESGSAVPVEVLLALADESTSDMHRTAQGSQESTFGRGGMTRKCSEMNTTNDSDSVDNDTGIPLHVCNSAVTSVNRPSRGRLARHPSASGDYSDGNADTVKTEAASPSPHHPTSDPSCGSPCSAATRSDRPRIHTTPTLCEFAPATGSSPPSPSPRGSHPPFSFSSHGSVPPAAKACGVTVAYQPEGRGSTLLSPQSRPSDGLGRYVDWDDTSSDSAAPTSCKAASLSPMRRGLRSPKSPKSPKNCAYQRSGTEAQSLPPRPAVPAMEWIDVNVTPASPRDPRDRTSRSPSSSACTPRAADAHLRHSLSVLSSASPRTPFTSTMQAAREAVLSGNKQTSHEALEQVGEQVRMSRFHDRLTYRLLDEVKVQVDEEGLQPGCPSPQRGHTMALGLLEERLRLLDSLEFEESDEEEFEEYTQPDDEEDVLAAGTLYFQGRDAGKAMQAAEEYDGFIPKAAQNCFTVKLPRMVDPDVASRLAGAANLDPQAIRAAGTPEGGMEFTIKDADHITSERLKEAVASVVQDMALSELDVGANEEGCMELVDNLLTWYEEKPGDVISELVANLRFPPQLRTRHQKRRSLARIVRSLEERARAAGVNPVEAMVLRQYTQKPMDIDRDVGWPDVPMPPRGPQDLAARLAVSEYESRCSDWDWSKVLSDPERRNGSLFGPVCAALRDQGPNGTLNAWSEAVLRKWIKWLFAIAAVTTRVSDNGGSSEAVLYRGLGAGGLPESTVLSHRCMPQGCCLTWPALSSLSYDCEQSTAYMYGRAINANNRPNPERPGTILFSIRGVDTGLPLAKLSQYPEEDEVLLGPLMTFEVEEVSEDKENPFDAGLLIRLRCAGMLGDAPVAMRQDLRGFLEEVREDVEVAYLSLTNTVSPASHPHATPRPSPRASPRRKNESSPVTAHGILRVVDDGSTTEGPLTRELSSLSLTPKASGAALRPGRKGWVRHRVNCLEKTLTDLGDIGISSADLGPPGIALGEK